MPELPEVETTCRGIEPYLLDCTIDSLELRERRMRWPVEDSVLALEGQKITAVRRRAKYVLVESERGTLILHLGMSGSLRICPKETELRKHDHFIARLSGGNGMEMRLHDPRRFGAVLWHAAEDGDIHSHPLFNRLGPEPLEGDFTPAVLIDAARGRQTSIKQVIMNNHVVVGVGNIYACEALFRSGIRPTKKAGRVSQAKLTTLVGHIRDVLAEAIQQGGTTLRDFVNEEGKPGYFKQQLNVYGREGEPCHQCQSPIKRVVISNRSTFYCPKCQS
ncbi:bifunctional DNA-formamidopyrimidine glycosylase/DNA-(apurinic or apyrimidinic site) lyase [Verrucomicrobiaceae bacterium R5-34]|uniref:Formamidopyrimidine-DNA glycosylase n=1 Tax=Oceaniferula flava TaxID=2800421 RepID=A0AAE2SGH9_9BACT|nr:bifunctional DNA-formamidopyrimidine glycosylase/DNA-(apurinic or apyrimidinic site) lyase [Oceaniferula flavus]MBK1829746.1 bifunctional DNA-formamidopyrimidine glycosylase/DNA-(apurinic or apyrimidinic site) lyase [Verrucomicrobiaceae bacterium R5-34]MBK1856449.1 bifunctional DNA-formamidopyrimidine glycosylase/DNA-(apurinic or apyrimidinic site) lyase [Oceaniferula flavus]MBM1137756.1 bifunctional DNA-formamidopyrimidine glycosylase/DNA-(apurinic or apyrimidinic site) lyase [Oceaniferula f